MPSNRRRSLVPSWSVPSVLASIVVAAVLASGAAFAQEETKRATRPQATAPDLDEWISQPDPLREIDEEAIGRLRASGYSIVVDQESIQSRLDSSFPDLGRSQLPTGILLEKAAATPRIFLSLLELEKPGATLRRVDFENIYGTLTRATTGAEMLPLEELQRRASRWNDQMATPLSVAVIDYQTLGRDGYLALSRSRDGSLALPAGKLGRSERFVGSAAQTRTVHSFNPRFVVPRDLFMVHTGGEASKVKPRDLVVRVGGLPEQGVALNEPFFVEGLVCVPEVCAEDLATAAFNEIQCELDQDCRKPAPACLEPDAMKVSYEVSFELEGRRHEAPGEMVVSCTGPPPTTPPPPPPPAAPCNSYGCPPGVQCFNLEDPVTALLPFAGAFNETGQGPFGSLNIRIYPAGGTVDCSDEGEVSLLNPIVVVDGIDIFNTRNQNDIYDDFGSWIQVIRSWGYDVISVDYTNGRDWIERNGLAIRELLVNQLPQWVVPEVLAQDRVAVLAGSMGTQTARWALRTAELAGEDHNTGLFVAVDGPFQGANIPISLQALIEFGVELMPAAQSFLDGLQSPAASELLLRTFYPIGVDPWQNTIHAWYQQHPVGAAYYDTVNASGFGLPTQTRNVSLISGSGTGTRQHWNAGVKLLYGEQWETQLIWPLPPIWCTGGVEIEARGDATGRVFHGLIDAACIFNLFGDYMSMDLTLGAGQRLDVAPGGTRQTQEQILSAFEQVDLPAEFSDFELYSDLTVASFIPSFSSLGITGVGVNYDPSNDPGYLNRTPFDSVFWEKCNVEHVSGATGDAFGFVRQELLAYRDQVDPPYIEPYQNACGIGEEEDLCLGTVFWFADPAAPVEKEPWYDGANCFVTPYPSGSSPVVKNDSYYIEPEQQICFDGSSPVGLGCPYSEIQGAIIGASLDGYGNLEILLVGHHDGGPDDCPENTTFQSVEPGEFTNRVLCSIDPAAGTDVSTYFLDDSFTLMIPPAVGCGAGYSTSVGSEYLCYLGTAPVGMSAFKYQGAFYYDGPDG